MADSNVLSIIESAAYERDKQEFAFGDTLDIKTGLILAALTFLAIWTGDLLKTSTTPLQVGFQTVSILSLLVGGVLSVAELWPRDYGREAIPRKYLDWVTETEKYREQYPESGTGPVTAEQLSAERIKVAVANVETNFAINKVKSMLMFSAFFCVAVSFGVNILTLITRLF